VRRWAKWAFCLAAGAAVGMVAAVVVPPGPRPGRAAFDRVRVGMTRAEVRAAVGGPPGDYAGGSRGPYTCFPQNHLPDGHLPWEYSQWYADDAMLLVAFRDEVAGRSPNARAVDVHVEGYQPRRPPTWVERARAWAGL
jgi:hypothetical protein